MYKVAILILFAVFQLPFTIFSYYVWHPLLYYWSFLLSYSCASGTYCLSSVLVPSFVSIIIILTRTVIKPENLAADMLHRTVGTDTQFVFSCSDIDPSRFYTCFFQLFTKQSNMKPHFEIASVCLLTLFYHHHILFLFCIQKVSLLKL